jgi:hypothetical protein
VSTSSQALRPGIAWNATRAAGVLMVVIIAVIALVFWPSFTSGSQEPSAVQWSSGVAAPHQPIVVDGEACVQCLP